MSNRLPLGACVRGPSVWILWQTARDSLRSRLRQLEVDPYVHGDVVRHFRGTLNDLEQAALEFREWERVRSAADSVEVSSDQRDGGLGNLPNRWGVAEVAALLNCSPRWVTALCQQGRLAATKHGREWRIDADSVEDYKARGVEAA